MSRHRFTIAIDPVPPERAVLVHAQTGETMNDGIHDYELYQSSDTWGAPKDQKYRQYRLNGNASFNGKLDIGKFLQHYVDQAKRRLVVKRIAKVGQLLIAHRR